MSRPPRIQFEGAYYHVYNRGVAKMPIVQDDRDRKTFLDILAKSIKKYQLRLFAYCVMTNHYHLFLQTPKANLDQAMWFWLRQYVTYFNRRHGRVGPLHQARYQAKLVDTDEYAQALIRYLHQNPLEAGLVKRPEDYPWSSYPCLVGKLPRWPWLDAGWTLAQFGSLEVFKRFHAWQPAPPLKKLLTSPNRHTLGGKDVLIKRDLVSFIPKTLNRLDF